MTLAYIRAMQADCRDRYLVDGDEGALLGLSDWVREEELMREDEPEYFELAEQRWRAERKEQLWNKN